MVMTSMVIGSTKAARVNHLIREVGSIRGRPVTSRPVPTQLW